jgi:tetratricopeptide (TPR) repeat protein
VLDAMTALANVFPLASQQVDEVSGTVPQISRALAAGELITSRLDCGPEVCGVTLNRVRGADGALLWTRTFQAPLDRPDLLVDAVQGHLLQTYKGRPLREGSARTEVRPADYAEYLRLFRGFDKREETDLPVDQVLARLRNIETSSPRFLAAYLFEADLREYRFRSQRDPADLESGFAVLEQARRLSPADPRPDLRQFSLALAGRQFDRAEEALRRLERLQPGDPRVLAGRARLLDRRGDTARAVGLMEAAARQLPYWKHLFWAGDMNYRLGRIDPARAELNEALQRSSGNFVAQSKLAELELMLGSPRRAAELYSNLVQRSPQFDELTNLGTTLMLLGRYDEATARFHQALALAPGNPLALLSLADATLMAGKRPEAESLYREVLRVSGKDPAAATDVQILSSRSQSFAHLGRSREALRELQEALRLAPESPEIAYEAAVVYAVLGDWASARFQAERALDHGYAARWFSFPWFEPLRAIPEFRRRLS